MSSSGPETRRSRRVRNPGVPPEKMQRLQRRGGRGTKIGQDDIVPSLFPTMNTFVWNGSFEEVLRFVCGRIPSSTGKKLTVRDMVSPPAQRLAMYLGEEEPIEPQIHSFIRKLWGRIYEFLMNPLPGVILQAQFRRENIPSIEQGLSQRFSELEQTSLTKEFQKQKRQIEQAKQVAKVATNMQKTASNYDAETLAAMRQKLLDRIQKIIDCFRQKNRISRRGAATMIDIIKNGNVPSEFITTIEPEVIALFINELGILKVRQKGQRPPKIVLNTFTA